MTLKFVRNSYFVIVGKTKHTKHVDKVKTLKGKTAYISKCLYS